MKSNFSFIKFDSYKLLIHLIPNTEEIEEKELADALLTKMGKIVCQIKKKEKDGHYELRNSKIVVPAKRASA